MIIAALLLTGTPQTVADGPALGALGRQELPAKGCAAFLWSVRAPPVLTAVIGADPARMQVVLDGARIDLALAVRRAAAPLGFAASADYTSGAVTITLDMNVQLQVDLKDGARVPAATLTITRPDHDVVIVPTAGLIGCAPA